MSQDNFGDGVPAERIEQEPHGPYVRVGIVLAGDYLVVRVEVNSTSRCELKPREARRLARVLLEKADELEVERELKKRIEAP